MNYTLVLVLVAVMVVGLNAYAYIGTDGRCEGKAGRTFQIWKKCEKITCLRKISSGAPNANTKYTEGCDVASLYISPEDVKRGCKQRQVKPRKGLNYPKCCRVYVWCPKN